MGNMIGHVMVVDSPGADFQPGTLKVPDHVLTQWYEHPKFGAAFREVVDMFNEEHGVQIDKTDPPDSEEAPADEADRQHTSTDAMQGRRVTDCCCEFGYFAVTHVDYHYFCWPQDARS